MYNNKPVCEQAGLARMQYARKQGAFVGLAWLQCTHVYVCLCVRTFSQHQELLACLGVLKGQLHSDVAAAGIQALLVQVLGQGPRNHLPAARVSPPDTHPSASWKWKFGALVGLCSPMLRRQDLGA